MKKLFVLILALIFLVNPVQADLSGNQLNSVVSLAHKIKLKKGMFGTKFAGTAFFISPNYVLSAAHVDQRNVPMFFNIGERYYPLTLVASNHAQDVILYYSPEYTSRSYIKVSYYADDSMGQGTMAYGNFKVGGGKFLAHPGHMMSNMKGSSHQSMCTSVVYPGFSGGPVINRQTNQLIGIIQQHWKDNKSECIMLNRQHIINFLVSHEFNSLIIEEAKKEVKNVRKH